MSFDTERLHKLRSKGFDSLFDKSKEKYKEMADTALKYARTCVPPGEKVRLGDVVAVIQNAVRIDPAFETHLKKNKLVQKYWVTYFAEYVLDQVYPQPDLTKAQ